MEIFLAPASATGFLEACVRCGVNRKMCGISNGSFGDRWQGIGTANGKLVDKIDAEWGKGVKPEHIKGKLMKDIEAVTFISNESSTGVFNRPTEICDADQSGERRPHLRRWRDGSGRGGPEDQEDGAGRARFRLPESVGIAAWPGDRVLQRTPDQEGRDR